MTGTDAWIVASFVVSFLSLALASYAVFRGRHRVSVALQSVGTWTAGVGSVPVARVAVTSIGRAMSIEGVVLEWVTPLPAPSFQYGNVQPPALPLELSRVPYPGEEMMPTFDPISGGYLLSDGERKSFFFQVTINGAWSEPSFQLRATVKMAHRNKLFVSDPAAFLTDGGVKIMRGSPPPNE